MSAMGTSLFGVQMGIKKPMHLILLFFTFLFASFFIQGLEAEVALPYDDEGISHSSLLLNELLLQGVKQGWRSRNSRRMMIGSTAPTCTYNECRGCKFKCRAEQIPVDANDPINSAYHYRCVCHR
ncbi:PREDICTED: uncharacterized protein LOC104586287 [Nelumbo nucifera]|uniref:Uncharacterized protein LOC104586287 n=2 Tax=Nelumbo nucifera TaxID=4432 RepID=A0A1U7YV75_NELNU|nr:PREDICTED: uncharacterized protein LOC104586287 [Nelumbo nucifera]